VEALKKIKPLKASGEKNIIIAMIIIFGETGTKKSCLLSINKYGNHATGQKNGQVYMFPFTKSRAKRPLLELLFYSFYMLAK